MDLLQHTQSLPAYNYWKAVSSARHQILSYIPVFVLSTMPPRPRRWWREYFIDHPQASSPTRSNEARANPKSDKTRCICRACFEPHIRHAQADDLQEYHSNQRSHVRDREAIIEDCT
jgi:hypothetical protein